MPNVLKLLESFDHLAPLAISGEQSTAAWMKASRQGLRNCTTLTCSLGRSITCYMDTTHSTVSLVLADNLWVRHTARSGLNTLLSHPHPAAPRCISCTSVSPPEGSEGEVILVDGKLTYHPPRVCGECSVEAACEPYVKADVECEMPSAHGGAVSE